MAAGSGYGTAAEGEKMNRKGSRERIASYIYHQGVTSKQEISRELAISMPTVLQCVRTLVEDGIAEEAGEYHSTGGRKAKQIAICRNYHYAVGADITENHQCLLLMDGRGQKQAVRRIRRPFTGDEAYWDGLAEEIAGLLADESVDGQRLLGVGISLPCIVDQKRQMILRSHVLRMEQVDLAPAAARIPWPVRFWNDANSAAYGELHGEERDAVYLSLSNTVGGAIYREGAICMGDHFRAGEFGHMVLVPEGKNCYCGKDGCMDAYCSVRALCGTEADQPEEFLGRLKAGDPRAAEDWENYLYYLALAVTNLRMAYDCDIVLGGYLGSCLEEYREQLTEKMCRWNRFDQDASYLRFGKRGKEAAAMGTARQLMEDFWENF
ncbi:MAG TPA: ROK family transcriptional regulator [Candidatus Pullilachnospira intestinigallinarum]|nr:ROK family transcriptional regulator [Candidatus Pullilachnospira intestinigallinarum]